MARTMCEKCTKQNAAVLVNGKKFCALCADMATATAPGEPPVPSEAMDYEPSPEMEKLLASLDPLEMTRLVGEVYSDMIRKIHGAALSDFTSAPDFTNRFFGAQVNAKLLEYLVKTDNGRIDAAHAAYDAGGKDLNYAQRIVARVRAKMEKGKDGKTAPRDPNLDPPDSEDRTA